jgi:hypothetical protein
MECAKLRKKVFSMLHLVSTYNNGASRTAKPILFEERYTIFSRDLNEESFNEKRKKNH